MQQEITLKSTKRMGTIFEQFHKRIRQYRRFKIFNSIDSNFSVSSLDNVTAKLEIHKFCLEVFGAKPRGNNNFFVSAYKTLNVLMQNVLSTVIILQNRPHPLSAVHTQNLEHYVGWKLFNHMSNNLKLTPSYVWTKSVAEKSAYRE